MDENFRFEKWGYAEEIDTETEARTYTCPLLTQLSNGFFWLQRLKMATSCKTKSWFRKMALHKQWVTSRKVATCSQRCMCAVKGWMSSFFLCSVLLSTGADICWRWVVGGSPREGGSPWRGRSVHPSSWVPGENNIPTVVSDFYSLRIKAYIHSYNKWGTLDLTVSASVIGSYQWWCFLITSTSCFHQHNF